MKKIAILASGSGSNAESIMNWAKGSAKAQVVCLLSDKKGAGALERASKFGVPAFYVKKKKSESRNDYDQKLIVALKDYDPDWIVLAGYMKLLTPGFLHVFRGRVINIHPSLLPLFPGKNGYAEAFAAGVSESGCTVHYVDEGMDTGEIIAQKSFLLKKGETFDEFKSRGLLIENAFYPEILEKLLTNSL